MLLSYRWLAKLARVTTPPAQLAERLTMGGVEIENIADFGFLSGALVAARIAKVEPHPHSEKLWVCHVDAGKHGTLQIVCGAPNTRENIISLLALKGARLPSGLLVKQARIRDVDSEGMLCSGAEAGWNGDHEGILELADDTPIGEPYDCLFDVKVTPNRSDCLSVFGVARDIAGLEGRELYQPQTRLRETMDPISASAQVTVRDKKACPRYTCRLLRKAKVGKSPVWLQRALESCGLRSINNVVDVTNYVLMEYGHPLHAFDLDKVANKHIIVRMAEAGERLTLLDGKSLDLNVEDLVIADADRAIALAGIMGGRNSEIGDATINVLLESAYFDPVTIRRTSKRHGLRTDSAYRFERGTDYKQVLGSLNRAVQMIADLAGAEIVKGAIDSAPLLDLTPVITMNIPRACMILGCDLTPTAIADRLVHLGFETIRSDREQLVVRAPSYRNDVTRDVDLIEEIARVHGYDAIQETTPYLPARPFAPSRQRLVQKSARQSLAGAGFWEAINYSFVGRDLLEKCAAPVEGAVEILNPLTADQAVLRTSLLPSLIHNIQTNQRRETQELRLFEMGKVYRRDATAQGEGGPAQDQPYVETPSLALVMAGRQGSDRGRTGQWRAARREPDFHDMKGAVETLLADLGIVGLKAVRATPAHLHPGRAAELKANDATVAVVGELHPDVARAMDLRGRVIAAELALAAVERLAHFDATAAPLPRFPKVDRDIALVVGRAVEAGSLEAAIRDAAGALLEEVRLFDLYEGDRIEKGKKSLAYSMSFRAPDRTLREEEVDGAVRGVVEKLSADFGAALRSE